MDFGRNMTDLYNKLKKYNEAGAYAFHMPGHKRNKIFEYCNPFDIDITEIDGFDDLNHSEGILKDCMQYAAERCGADKTYFLINGSTSGILSAVSATADYGEKILISRNCHKAVYNAIELRGLKPLYIYPEYIGEYGVSGGINPSDVESILLKNRDVKVVVIVSPTYDGICSDVEKIAGIVHGLGGVLIVDEAHGAHFRYNEYFPESALDLGADIVIQSIHKTLPSFTQTALLHVKSKRVNNDRLQKYLSIYQSSSPSYVLMAGIDRCIRWMEDEGKKYMEGYCRDLKKLRKRLGSLENILLLSEDIVDKYSVKALDCGKIIISLKNLNAGKQLYDLLRIKYKIQPEMCTDRYVTLMTSVGDSEEALEYLGDILCGMDKAISDAEGLEDIFENNGSGIECRLIADGVSTHEKLFLAEKTSSLVNNEMVISPAKTAVLGKEEVSINNCSGRVCGDYVYIYPPGIPLLVPGERINQEVLDVITGYISMGLKVHGIKDLKISVLSKFF